MPFARRNRRLVAVTASDLTDPAGRFRSTAFGARVSTRSVPSSAERRDRAPGPRPSRHSVAAAAQFRLRMISSTAKWLLGGSSIKCGGVRHRVQEGLARFACPSRPSTWRIRRFECPPSLPSETRPSVNWVQATPRFATSSIAGRPSRRIPARRTCRTSVPGVQLVRLRAFRFVSPVPDVDRRDAAWRSCVWTRSRILFRDDRDAGTPDSAT